MTWLRHMLAVAQKSAKKQDIEIPDFDEFWERGFWEFKTPVDRRSCLKVSKRSQQDGAEDTVRPDRDFSETIDSFRYEAVPAIRPGWNPRNGSDPKRRNGIPCT